MGIQQQRSPPSLALVSLGLVGAGAYFVLVGLGLAPPPGTPHAPGWIVMLVGLVSLLAGLLLVPQALGLADEKAQLAPNAPPWMRNAQDLAGIAVFGLFAVVGTWVSLGGDDAGLTMTTSFTGDREMPANPVVARIAFGIGALITWLIFALLARRFWRLHRAT